MGWYVLKLFISAAVIVVVTECAKVNATVGGFIKSLPLISLLSFIWLYIETRNVEAISQLAISTIWFVLPTFPMFIVLAACLNRGVGFTVSLLLSIASMIPGYVLAAKLLKL